MICCDILLNDPKYLYLMQLILQHQYNINLHRCSDTCHRIWERPSHSWLRHYQSHISHWVIEFIGTAATCAGHPNKVLDEIPDASSMDILKAIIEQSFVGS